MKRRIISCILVLGLFLVGLYLTTTSNAQDNAIPVKPALKVYVYDMTHNLFSKEFIEQLKTELKLKIEKTNILTITSNYKEADIVINGFAEDTGYGMNVEFNIDDVNYKKFNRKQSINGTESSISSQLYQVIDDVIRVAEKILEHKNNLAKKYYQTLKKVEKFPMILIKGGSFQMGSNSEKKDEQPLTSVTIKDFYMDVYEVTNYQYKQFILANPKWQKGRVNPKSADEWYLWDWNVNDYPEGQDTFPVRYISWYAARDYAKWVGGRLPTEGEWEYAAGGKEHFTYSLANNFVQSQYAFDRNGPESVGSYKPNSFGLYDMTGNIAEWCLTLYEGYPYKPMEDARDYMSLTLFKEQLKSVRGGSWDRYDPRFVRTQNRMAVFPTKCRLGIGFRIVKDVEEKDKLDGVVRPFIEIKQ